jgi:hypothetical protein
MYKQYNSSANAEMSKCIAASKSNPITIANLSELYIYDNIAVYAPESVVEDYMPHIEENLIEMTLPESLHFRPEALSESLYGTPDLFYVLMLVNGCSSVTNFNMEKVKVLNPTSKIIGSIAAARMKGLNKQRSKPYIVNDLTLKEIM